ncbi:hypothetical protein ES288_D11G154900v1 [Gossypium darwinii]|uniref:Cns1/TTC4 wheel domain-containing protein n=1 Tax=Gossypium darwinii TaxID=34276 RepID=A0A5D2ALT3_GOSDA|nr:hypothetical protein ES288_D11G154900v1 [Gossypium darwinii]
MALWMETGSEPKTETEIADLEAISALKESTALELKEKGNELVKKGKKHYPEAIHCYSRAIDQKALNDHDTSVLFSNRAHVNLLLGNYRRALSDSQDAIKLFPANVKDLVSAIEDRRLKLGNAMYRELTGLRKPVLDKNGILHWPVLLLYAEFMSSDFIEDFCETDMFSAHLDIMFSESCPPLPWDKENHYSRDAIELYYEAGSGICLSKSKILRYLLEGTAAANVESIGEEEKDAADGSPYDSSAGSYKWVKVNEKRTLHDVLNEPNFIIPMIPVFYVVSKRSGFYKDFITGKWRPPA